MTTAIRWTASGEFVQKIDLIFLGDLNLGPHERFVRH